MDAVATPDISLFADFRLDRRGGALYRRDEQGVFELLAIGRRALDILGLLIERPGDLVSRGEIIEAVWHGRAVEDSNLNVQIAALRRILDAVDSGLGPLTTVASLFRASINCVAGYLRLRQETHSLRPRPNHGGRPPANPEQRYDEFRRPLARQPDSPRSRPATGCT